MPQKVTHRNTIERVCTGVWEEIWTDSTTLNEHGDIAMLDCGLTHLQNNVDFSRSQSCDSLKKFVRKDKTFTRLATLKTTIISEFYANIALYY